MNIDKIEFGLIHGTNAQKKEMGDWIYKLNIMAESIWYKSKTSNASSSSETSSSKIDCKSSEPSTTEKDSKSENFVKAILSNDVDSSKLMKKAKKTPKSWKQTKEISKETLINVKEEGLNCPFCTKIVAVKFKRSKNDSVRWKINKFKSYLRRRHVKEKVISTELAVKPNKEPSYSKPPPVEHPTTKEPVQKLTKYAFKSTSVSEPESEKKIDLKWEPEPEFKNDYQLKSKRSSGGSKSAKSTKTQETKRKKLDIESVSESDTSKFASDTESEFEECNKKALKPEISKKKSGSKTAAKTAKDGTTKYQKTNRQRKTVIKTASGSKTVAKKTKVLAKKGQQTKKKSNPKLKKGAKMRPKRQKIPISRLSL